MAVRFKRASADQKVAQRRAGSAAISLADAAIGAGTGLRQFHGERFGDAGSLVAAPAAHLASARIVQRRRWRNASAADRWTKNRAADRRLRGLPDGSIARDRAEPRP